MSIGQLFSRLDKLEEQVLQAEMAEAGDVDLMGRMHAVAAQMRAVMVNGASPDGLPEFWHTPFGQVDHEQQSEYFSSPARFKVNHSGRRSGKSWVTKAMVFVAAMEADTPWPDPRFFFGAPVERQAQRIFWTDILAAIPAEFIAALWKGDHVQLVNGASIWVIGFDRPSRFEGPPWDGGQLDEYADMKEATWPEHVRPALSDRRGWCALTGVPNGRNHFFRLRQQHARDEDGIWQVWSWHSDTVLPAEEIQQAQADLDLLTYRQEYGGEFISMEGSAYYTYNNEIHHAALKYDQARPLILCFDFNVSPGTAVVCQEQKLPSGLHGTGCIGEVWIERNSTTPKVCREIVAEWGKHKAEVICYGDASGGSSGTSQVMGSDWDLIESHLRPIFGDRLEFVVPSGNPAVKSRVNSLCSRLQAADNSVHMQIDAAACPKLIEDFEGVVWNKSGSDLDDKDKWRTHMTDALGYYTAEEWPVVRLEIGSGKMRA